MKKSIIVIGSLAATMIATAALAAPADRKGPGPRHHEARRHPGIEQQKRNDLRIPENAPEEIKAMYKEFFSINHDLRLELNKDNPDGAKALEMVFKAEDLHKSLRQWKVGQILEGKMPKPELTPRGGEAMPAPEAGKAPAPRGPEAPEGEGPMPMLGFGCKAPVPPCGPEKGPEAPKGEGPMPMLGFGCKAPVPPCGPEKGPEAPMPDFRAPAPCAPVPCAPVPEAGVPFGAPRPDFRAPAPGMKAPFPGPRPNFEGPAGTEAPAPEAFETPEAPAPEADAKGPGAFDKLGQAIKDITGSISDRISGEEPAPEANPDAGIMTLEETAPEDKPAE